MISIRNRLIATLRHAFRHISLQVQRYGEMVLEAKSPNTPTATPRTRFDNAVSFSLIPEIRYFDAPLPDLNRRPPRSRLKMTKKTFEQYEGNQITDEMLREAAQLFSKNYGVWGTNALKSIGPFAKPGWCSRIV